MSRALPTGRAGHEPSPDGLGHSVTIPSAVAAASLLNLAERVEAADGPNGDLDALIDEAMGWRRVDNPTHAGGLIDLWHLPDGTTGRRNERLGAYTHSLDAALTLVPEGCQWSFCSHYTMATVWRYWTPLDGEDEGSEAHQSEAATPALALTAAALRAQGMALREDAPAAEGEACQPGPKDAPKGTQP